MSLIRIIAIVHGRTRKCFRGRTILKIAQGVTTQLWFIISTDRGSGVICSCWQPSLLHLDLGNYLELAPLYLQLFFVLSLRIPHTGRPGTEKVMRPRNPREIESGKKNGGRNQLSFKGIDFTVLTVFLRLNWSLTSFNMYWNVWKFRAAFWLRNLWRTLLENEGQVSSLKSTYSIRISLSRVECNLSSRKLAQIALNQRNARTNSKVEHVASMVYCIVVESSNTSEISAAWITLFPVAT